MMFDFTGSEPWLPVKDGDYRALGLFRRHYSYGKNRRLSGSVTFAGPNAKVYMTQECDALWVWRNEHFRHDDQVGAQCAVFRNEGERLSSRLILAAEPLALSKWPEIKRFFTFVDPKKVASKNPGYCFIMAGWRRCGMSKGGLLIFEKNL